ncbi:hypothetical protein [Aureimonas sp. AU4]|uniref:DUF6894 family protein n=1 Tax=Aureimonas sp. AU4 TaxID=1638163 RepID=UPI000782DDC8|nr:hypothetical protein [Aureimonas sp. AU4]
MPRYFFPVSGTVSHPDPEGQELPDDLAAWSVAVSSMGELLRDLDGHLPIDADVTTLITDEIGRVLITLQFTARRHTERGPITRER